MLADTTLLYMNTAYWIYARNSASFLKYTVGREVRNILGGIRFA
jgi:hypothetical protein